MFFSDLDASLVWVKKVSFCFRPTAAAGEDKAKVLMVSAIFSNELLLVSWFLGPFPKFRVAVWWQNVSVLHTFALIYSRRSTVAKLNARMQSNFRGVFTRGRMHYWETFWEIFQYLFFTSWFPKSLNFVFDSSDQVDISKKFRFNKPCFPDEKKKSLATTYRWASLSTYFHDFRVDIEYLSWESFGVE